MAALDPSGDAQPTLNQAYTTPGNPADKEPLESAQADANARTNDEKTDTRAPVPQTQSSSQADAMPTSVARGVRGAPPGEEAAGKTDEDVGRHNELDGQQMRAPGEGDVRDVVEKKPGASGAQEGLESDLDRKKVEQAPAREAVKEQRQQKVDVAGVLGQTGGPANPVDKDGYPNK
ncbi:hypothetical protein B0A49_06541 [Cryomyces minteri]|uniref:Uncharacterized protein n=1 Tax=Cryomyces minteri TaxID=331657 RepID=A0A4U0WU39_9PEZI|nr:hypothetical protein B0A49_06541 [Cryomyces minteri]